MTTCSTLCLGFIHESRIQMDFQEHIWSKESKFCISMSGKIIKKLVDMFFFVLVRKTYSTLWTAIKFGGLKKNSTTRTGSRPTHQRRAAWQNFFFKPPTLPGDNSDALWHTETHSTSLERAKPPPPTQTLFKSLVALLRHFISSQNTPISIGLM